MWAFECGLWADVFREFTTCHVPPSSTTVHVHCSEEHTSFSPTSVAHPLAPQLARVQGEKALKEKKDVEVFGPYAANLTKLDWEVYEMAADLFWNKLYDVYQAAGFEMMCTPSPGLLVEPPPAPPVDHTNATQDNGDELDDYFQRPPPPPPQFLLGERGKVAMPLHSTLVRVEDVLRQQMAPLPPSPPDHPPRCVRFHSRQGSQWSSPFHGLVGCQPTARTTIDCVETHQLRSSASTPVFEMY